MPRIILSCLAWFICQGCATKTTEPLALSMREAQVEAHDNDLVQDSARLYWEAVRWGDGNKAASFLEDPDERLLFEAWMEDEMEMRRYTEVQVLQVKMHPEEENPPSDRLRIATAHVRVKSYTLPAQVLKSETLKQQWYKSPDGWWIDWELPAD